MKKSELNKLIQEMIREAFQDVANTHATKKPPATQHYRRSKRHPEERARRLAAKAARKSDIPFVKKAPVHQTMGVFNDRLTSAVEQALAVLDRYPALTTQVFDPKTRQYVAQADDFGRRKALATADAILTGQNILKKDILALAKFMVANRIFPDLSFKQLAVILADLRASHSH